MNRKSRRRKSSSSSDDIPLKNITKNVDQNHYDTLCQQKYEKCEFCDTDFRNRLQCLKHTARHIIIPLIKLKIFQCQYCLFCFTTQGDLILHKKVKHTSEYLKELMLQVVTQSVAVECEKIDFTPLENDNETNKSVAENKTNVNTIPVTQNNVESIKPVKNELLLTENVVKNNFNVKKIIGKKLTVVERQAVPEAVIRSLHLKGKPINAKTLPGSLNNKIILKNHTEGQSLPKNQPSCSYLTNCDIKPLLKPQVIGPTIIINDIDDSKEEFILPDISPAINRSITSRLQFEEDVDTSISSPKIGIPHTVAKKSTTHNIIKTNSFHKVKMSKNITNISKYSSEKPNITKTTPEPNLDTPDGYASVKIKITVDKGVITGVMPLVKVDKPVFEDEEWKSIHYDQLVRPGMFRCHCCGLTFPNRFDVINHETLEHLRFKRRYIYAFHCKLCDWYIAGNNQNLMQHIKKKHNTHYETFDTVKKCTRCSLKYTSFARHCEIYHPHENISLNNSKKLVNVTKCQLCDVCSMFVKNNFRSKKRYESIGVLQEYGRKYKCSDCHNKVDAVEMFKLYSYTGHHKWERKEKNNSKEERLRKIQNRLIMLKKIKKLSVYGFCFFGPPFFTYLLARLGKKL